MKYQENESVELKEVYVEDVRKEIIAFANTNGGTVYIGVKDNGDVVGVNDIKLVENGFKPLPTWQDAVSRYLKETRL